MAVMQEVRARFVAEVAGMRSAFEQVRREAASIEPTVRRSTEQANRHYAKVSTAVNELKEKLEETNNTELFKDLDKAAARARREFERTGQVSSRTMQTLERAIDSTTDTISNLGDEGRRRLGGLESVIADTREAMQDLTGSVEDTSDALNDMGGTNLDRTNRELNETADNLENLGEQAEAASEEFNRMGDIAQEESRRTGQSLGRMAGDFANASDRAFSQAERGAQGFRRGMERLNPFDDIEREARQLERSIGRPINNLAEHLQPFRDSIVETQVELRNLGRNGGQSIDQLSRAATRSIVPARSLASMTDSGKKAAKMIQELTEDTRRAQLAIMGLNEDGTVQISTEESNRRLEEFRENVDETRRKLEQLRDDGDQGSYNAGMRDLEISLRNVDNAMRATATGGQRYQRMLREMGIYTADAANTMGINMERMRNSFFYNLDLMQARTNLSQRMMDFLPETSRIQRLDRFFLGISNGLENIAKKGAPARLAVEMLGRNAPMKKIMDLTRMIQQGVMGTQQLTLGASVVFGIFTAVMAKAATGPSPSEVAEEAGKALAEYHTALKERADDIMNTWNVFMDVQLEAVAPWKLKANLQEQVDLLGNWESDLNSLAGRIDNVDIMAYLRGLGPDAAMEIAALNDHTETGLQEWVVLFEEKSRIATRAAMTELEWMKHETDLKIKAMQDSLTPLSIAWENFLQTWTAAMTPFVNAWGIVAAKVVDGVTAVGAFIEKINQLNPQLSAMAGMFTYVATGLFILLAPLGVGIGLIKGMQANFNALFMMLKPAVVAFARVAGAVTVVSAAIIILGTIFYNLWKNSEDLRNALGSLASQIGDVLSKAIGSLKGPIDEMKAAFNAMVGEILGKGKTMSDFWQVAGDLIAKVITTLTDTYMPIFASGVGLLRDGIVAALKIMVMAFDSIREWWAKAAPMITPYISQLFGFMKTNSETAASAIAKAFATIKEWWDNNGPAILNVVKTVFGEVSSFIGSVLKKIVQFFQTDGAQLMTAAQNIFSFIGTIVKTVFDGVWAVVQFVWPAVLWLITSIWKNIQGVINGGLNIIMGLVKVFSGLFTGDFSKMWEGVKQLFFGAIEFVFNLVSLMFFGKILSGARLFITMFRSSFVSMWNAIKALFSGSGSATVAFLKRAWDEAWNATKTVFLNIWTYLKNTWDSIILIGKNFFTVFKLIFTQGFTIVRNFTTTTFQAIFNFFVNIFSKIYNAIRTAILNTENTMRNIFNTIYTFVRTIFTNIYTTIRTIFTNTSTFIRDIWTAIKNFLSTSVTNIWNLLSAGFRNIRTSIETISRGIRTFLESIWTTIKNFIGSAVSTIWTRAKTAWTNLKSDTTRIFGQIVDSVKSRFTSIVDAAKALPGRIGSAIGAMSSAVSSGVTKVINAMSATLGKGMNGVIKGLNWVLDKLGVNITIPQWNAPQWNSYSPAPAKSKAPAGKMKQYAKGTDNHPGGLAMVNDGDGEEMIVNPDGNAWIAKGRNVVIDLMKGAQVITAHNTRQLMHKMPKYAAGTGVLNKALDVMKYAKNPKGLLDLALKTLGVSAPTMPKIAGGVVKAGYNKVKDAALGKVKSSLATFVKKIASSIAENMGSGGGTNIMSGSGGNFGPPFRLTSRPGPRNTGIAGASRYHLGWDWAAPIGTPIPSQSAGTVSRTGYNPISGNFIEVKSGGLIHRYQHNSRNAASYGQQVKKGQTIAYSGKTGIGSGPHLHYELKRFANGGIATQEQLAWIADGGFAESIISHDPSKKASQKEIWNRTGDMLGFDRVGDSMSREILEALERIANGVESEKDMTMVMSDRKVGQIVSKHAQREAEVEKYRQNKFKGVTV